MNTNTNQADALREHTPGPWRINHLNDKIIIGGRAYGIENVLSIAEVTKLKHHSQENAWLIAAAPDLLAALQALLDWGRDYTGPTDPHSPHQLLVKAHNAIAKAKGGL
jgi:hypothetical protein